MKERPQPDQNPPKTDPSPFAGLINTVSEKDIGISGLTIADNIIGSDNHKIVTRPGYSLYRACTPASAWVVGDNFYFVDGSTLYRLVSATDVHSLTSGLTGKNYSWDSINGVAYFVNGVEAGIARGDAFLPLRIAAPSITSVSVVDSGQLAATPNRLGQNYATGLWRFCATYETFDGRESAPSEIFEVTAPVSARLFDVVVPTGYAKTHCYVTEPDGTVFRLAATSTASAFSVAPLRATRELLTVGTYPLPEGVDVCQFWVGKLWVSQYFAAEDTSVIWYSKPYNFHIFDQASDFIVVPGRVALLLGQDTDGMMIGTTQNVWHYDGTKLDHQVSYGVVPGTAGDLTPENIAYFWTTRGFCKAMPFENLTEKQLSLPPGDYANVAIVYWNGMQQVIASTQGGGTPFNARS